MNKKYYIGFDIGTDSIGWATTDEEYNLLRARGQDYWGVYLFDAAKTAKDRRMNRTSRRRTARKRQRIKLLQELFASEIAKVDFCFFERLNNSKYLVEDKGEDVRYRDCLFHDEVFRDKEYFKKYPTIYHLRAAFLEKESAKEIRDVRLLYLAVAHIIKNRGHFLFEGQTFNIDEKSLAEDAIYKINEILGEMDEDKQTFSVTSLDEVFGTLCNKSLTKSEKERKLKQLFDVGSDKTCRAIMKGIVGLQINVKDLFGEEDPPQKSLCFDDANFELEKQKEIFSEDEYALLCEMKTIYDWAVLTQILGNHKYVSKAMCAKYESHNQDLRLLKKYVKNNFGAEKYKEVFRKQKEINNYAAYVGKDGQKSFKHVSKEDFYKYLKSFVTDEEILKRINDGTFLDKQRSNANGVIPYQVHLAELETILNNASVNFPFLNETSDGWSVKKKIISLLTFRIPYYVGPLNTAHAEKGFAWCKKYDGMETTRITPWNFDQVVNKQASEDQFIRRMTNKCTYLVGEDVLPKQSLLYSEFAFLNELNNITFDGKKLDQKAREVLLNEAKDHNKKLTIKEILDVLAKEGFITQEEKTKEKIKGIDGEIKNGFSTLRFFKRVFGERFNEDMCEEIIKWFTIMGNKNDAAERAKRMYHLDEETTKKLKDLNCSGWGRLSKTFLNSTEIVSVDENGEVFTFIEAMRKTGCNLMELLSGDYGFKKKVEEFNAQSREDGKVTYQTIEDLYCSPSVKRAIWRTICLAREIEKVQGGPPERIFIEMARGDETEKKGQRTKSRKEQMMELYNRCKEDVRQWGADDLLGRLENESAEKLLKDRLYLYYMQMGRCAYTGRPIPLEEVFNTNICDIDHIYPQSIIPDDSLLNNRVLCCKTANAQKGDNYPVAQEIRANRQPIWSVWHKKGFISDEKYKRLTRATPLSQEEIADFINRQLVETRQSTKAVAQLLKQMYPATEIVYSKARNVVRFKNSINGERLEPLIVKVRELNDLHHAKDAYLNIVVGNVWHTKFNGNAKIYFARNQKNDKDININKLFAKPLKNAWDPSYKQKVISVVNKNTCRVVRFTSEGEGKLYEATIKTKGANDKLIPLKRNCPLEDTTKYGGYDSATTAYFALVKSLDKKKTVQISLEAIPVYIDVLGKEKVPEYLQKTVGLDQPQVLIEKIKINSLLKLNGAYVWLRGKTGAQIVFCNANELVLDHAGACYLKRITSFMQKQKEANAELNPSPEFDKLFKEGNIALYDVLVEKMRSVPYVNLPSFSAQIKTLEEKKNNFCELSERNQVLVLSEILRFMQCNSTLSNLSQIGGASNSGNIRHSKRLGEEEECLLITQSPTGYYKSIVNLTAFYRQ